MTNKKNETREATHEFDMVHKFTVPTNELAVYLLSEDETPSFTAKGTSNVRVLWQCGVPGMAKHTEVSRGNEARAQAPV